MVAAVLEDDVADAVVGRARLDPGVLGAEVLRELAHRVQLIANREGLGGGVHFDQAVRPFGGAADLFPVDVVVPGGSPVQRAAVLVGGLRPHHVRRRVQPEVVQDRGGIQIAGLGHVHRLAGLLVRVAHHRRVTPVRVERDRIGGLLGLRVVEDPVVVLRLGAVRVAPVPEVEVVHVQLGAEARALHLALDGDRELLLLLDIDVHRGVDHVDARLVQQRQGIYVHAALRVRLQELHVVPGEDVDAVVPQLAHLVVRRTAGLLRDLTGEPVVRLHPGRLHSTPRPGTSRAGCSAGSA